jgi:hypothetical protein
LFVVEDRTNGGLCRERELAIDDYMEKLRQEGLKVGGCLMGWREIRGPEVHDLSSG